MKTLTNSNTHVFTPEKGAIPDAHVYTVHYYADLARRCKLRYCIYSVTDRIYVICIFNQLVDYRLQCMLLLHSHTRRHMTLFPLLFVFCLCDCDSCQEVLAIINVCSFCTFCSVSLTFKTC